jgi:hypothetical protein
MPRTTSARDGQCKLVLVVTRLRLAYAPDQEGGQLIGTARSKAGICGCEC